MSTKLYNTSIDSTFNRFSDRLLYIKLVIFLLTFNRVLILWSIISNCLKALKLSYIFSALVLSLNYMDFEPKAHNSFQFGSVLKTIENVINYQTFIC